MDEEKAKEIFEALDSNKDGYIDLKELEQGLADQPTRAKLGAALLSHADANKDGQVDFAEFHKYFSDKSLKLKDVFDSIDVNKDGKLDKHEVRASLQKIYNMKISERAVEAMMKHVDKDGDGSLSFGEWLDYLLYLPIHSTNENTLQHIFDSWKEEAVVDFGDSIAVQSGSASAIRNLAAGGIAGAVSRTATAPLDRLKTLIQLQTKGSNVGILSGLAQIYKDGGALAFFRGNFANCLKIVPESATKFYAFDQIKNYLKSIRGELGAPEKFLAGSLAGVISQALVYPLDSLKILKGSNGSFTKENEHGTRISTSISKNNINSSPFFIYYHKYASGGVRAFYRGLSASVLGVIPYAGIDFAIYETLKTAYTDYQIENAGDKRVQPTPSVLVPLCCGTISSTIAQFASYPLALIRTRLQAQGLPNSEKYSGMVDAFSKTVKKEGFGGLYKGMGPNLLKVVPAVGISYVVYESVKNM